MTPALIGGTVNSDEHGHEHLDLWVIEEPARLSARGGRITSVTSGHFIHEFARAMGLARLAPRAIAPAAGGVEDQDWTSQEEAG